MVIKPFKGGGESEEKRWAKLYLTLNTRREKLLTALMKKIQSEGKHVQANSDT